MRRLILLLLALAACLDGMAQGVRKTADEFNKMSRNDTSLVILQGVVSRIGTSSRGTLYLQDGTGEAYVYGLVDGREGSDVSFPQMGIAVGDTLTVSGRRTVYDGRIIEMAGGHLLRKADGPDHERLYAKAREPDVQPLFRKKGSDAFSEWVAAHLEYPEEAKAAHMEGTVLVKFVVGTNGGVQEVEVVKGVFPALDREAVRVIKDSPKWKPAMKDGRPVRVTCTHPVVFSLPE